MSAGQAANNARRVIIVGTVNESGVYDPGVIPVTADTELPAAVLLADNSAIPTTPIIGAALMGSDGTTLDMIRSVAGSSDGLSQSLIGLLAIAEQMGWTGVAFERVRVVNIVKPVAAVTITSEATIWTPAASRKFRLMRLHLVPSADMLITLKDNTAGSTIAIVGGKTGEPITVDFGQGIISGAVNRVLTATGSAAGTISGTLLGTEET